MDLILETFSYQPRKTNLRKDLRWIHEHLEMCSSLNALSHAPELAYRNAPPGPYKGMLLQRVHTPQATQKQLQRLIKIISKQAPVNPDLISPGQRWRYCYRM